MFLVEKTQLTSPFKSKFTKKTPSHIPPKQQPASTSFHEEYIISHLKTLTPLPTSSFTLQWISDAVNFLTALHTQSLTHISSLRTVQSDYYHVLYMDYSLKLLDLCNLITSALQKLTERRMLMKLSLRLMNSTSSGEIPAPEKVKKAKDVLMRSVSVDLVPEVEKAKRAKELIGELIRMISSGEIPAPEKLEKAQRAKNLIGKSEPLIGKDLIGRTLYGLGVLTVFVSNVLVSVLYGRLDIDIIDVCDEIRVPAEFGWADSVNGMFGQIKSKKGLLKEVDDVRDVIGDGSEERLLKGGEELKKVVGKFSDGVDELTNSVNGLFRLKGARRYHSDVSPTWLRNAPGTPRERPEQCPEGRSTSILCLPRSIRNARSTSNLRGRSTLNWAFHQECLTPTLCFGRSKSGRRPHTTPFSL